MNQRIYLDYNATAPVFPKVRALVSEILEKTGNPSSIHTEGRNAKTILEKARRQVAQLVGAQAGQVIFTSGGTEANNLVLSPAVTRKEKGQSAQLYVSATEHDSVLAGGRFEQEQITRIPVNTLGQLDLDVLEQLLQKQSVLSDNSFMVSVMAANNETGLLQNIETIGALVHQFGGLFHVDAVQAAGKIALDFEGLPVDFLSLSAHKIGGLQGVGALIAKQPELLLNDVLIKGGGQEKFRRGGTQNVSGIVSFGVAAEQAAQALASEQERLGGLRSRLIDGLAKVNDKVVIVGQGAERLPNTVCFLSDGLKAENMLMVFDLAGIAVSSGSACGSGKVSISHVLQAMGYEEKLCYSAIRVSLGWQSKQQDIDAFLKVYTDIYERHKKYHAVA